MTARTDKHYRILDPGRNCWKVEKAERVSFLVDADAYFSAFRESAKLARSRILICGWDIDSRTAFRREGSDDSYPLQLGDFLNALAEERSELQIYILVWDFVRFMGMEREWFPQFKLGWNTHPDIHFRLDNRHPVGASMHHKLVVIDDMIAFCGGLDLTKQRWDTPGHHPDNEHRTTPEGEWYRPHHDIQIMVSGPPAESLGDYFRHRWQQVTDRKLVAIGQTHGNLWPDRQDVDVGNCDVAIARTRAHYETLSGIYEVEQLYLDSIASAREYIYVENQYLTAAKIIDALGQSLRADEGPEVVIVLPHSTDGWLSQNTMDTLRTRAVKQLREADVHSRLGIYYAHHDGLEGDDTIKIHSKMMIADDCFVRIGSSNLNNRSMGFDTECDLALEIDDDADEVRAIRNLRDSLLAEHLGTTVQQVRKTFGANNSLLASIRALQGNRRTLRPLEATITDSVELVAGEQDLFDPERPIEPEVLFKLWSPVKQLAAGSFRYIQFGLVIVILLGFAAAWHYSPLHEYLTAERLKQMAVIISGSNLAWLYVLCGYAVGSLLMIPITLLITLSILIFGIFEGVVFALLGSVLSASITYWCGRVLGRDTVRSLAGDKINTLSRKLGRNGLVSTLLIRLMPIAPYSIVNIVAGATHIRFADFILGTFLGMLPGTIAIAAIIDRGAALLSGPDTMTILSAVGLVAVIAGIVLFARKKLAED